jgi:hypothetical protein
MGKPTASYLFTTIADPNATHGTFPEGINKYGEVVGAEPGPSGWLGFTELNGNYADQDVPSSNDYTLSQGINNLGRWWVGTMKTASTTHISTKTGHTRRCQHYLRMIILLKGSTT